MSVMTEERMPQNPQQLVKKLEKDLAHPEFSGYAFAVPFEVDGLTEMAVRVVARAYNAKVEFRDNMCLVGRISA